MQSLLSFLPDSWHAGPGILIGFGLLAAVMVQTALAVIGSLRRQAQARHQFQLERERLAYEVRLAKSRWTQIEHEKSSWNGWRKFRVVKKAAECADVFSFVLQPHDGKSIPAFKPGQYLTFGLDIPGRDKQVVRCYSLSSPPSDASSYRVTIKKEKAPPDKPGIPDGVGSSFFVDSVREGDLLNVKAPTGHFHLETAKQSPVVLISAGVGITPVLSMALDIAAIGSRRETWFFFVCRNRSDHMLKAELDQLAARAENIRVVVCYSKPGPNDVQGRDYHTAGRLTPDVLKSVLPSNNYDYYLCGNGSFMKTMYEGLTEWGVPDAKIHYEAFGPATIKKTTATPPTTTATAAGAKAVQVTFGKSGKVVAWDPATLNLLDFALANEVRIDSGCRAGSCGSCSVAVKQGEVEYLGGETNVGEAGSCLACICRPKTDLVLDA
jgi:ferredoxin-NADP reductase